MHIISPQQIADGDLEKFHSSLREVMGCIKYSNDKNKLAAFIRGNPRMNMEVEAARVIETIARMGIEREEDEKKDDWLSEGRIQLLSTLIQSGDISLQKAAAIMNMTPEEFLAKSKTVS